MKVLIACEESQRVCIAFREKGHEAYSCDIIECSGGRPEYHIKTDVLKIINGNCEVITEDGRNHYIDKWNLIIAHPPCTYLTVTGNRWFNEERYGLAANKRKEDREKAVEFFMRIVTANCDKIAIENPIGVMSTRYRKPDQIIQPYHFGDPYRKATCLWLKGLPPLVHTSEVEPIDIYYYISSTGKNRSDSRERSKCKKEERARHRSKTYPGIAKAMAEQWG